MFIFCQSHKKTLKELNLLFDKPQFNTSQTINKGYFSEECKNKHELRSILGYSQNILPAKYLGLPLAINYVKPRNIG